MAHLTHQQGPLRPVYDGTMPAGGYVGEPGQAMTAGAGITSGTGTVYLSFVERQGPIVKTTIFIDLTGLNSGGSDGDIIGKNATANCHLGQITKAVNGSLFKGVISCVEVPTGGEPDIDVGSASVATGTEDAAFSGLSGQVVNLASAADFTAIGQSRTLTSVPVADSYLYLVASGGATDATYTAGQFVIELFGYAV